jgi:transcriptional regulator with XRE-family HTH domain
VPKRAHQCTVRKRTTAELALARQLARIVEGDVAEIAKRARISIRQLRYMRAGTRLDITLSTLARLADALEMPAAALIGGTKSRARRPAPIGKRPGKPRTMRREPHVGELTEFDEDHYQREED